MCASLTCNFFFSFPLVWLGLFSCMTSFDNITGHHHYSVTGVWVNIGCNSVVPPLFRPRHHPIIQLMPASGLLALLSMCVNSTVFLQPCCNTGMSLSSSQQAQHQCNGHCCALRWDSVQSQRGLGFFTHLLNPFLLQPRRLTTQHLK